MAILTSKTRMATVRPPFPILVAMSFSLTCSGVSWSSVVPSSSFFSSHSSLVISPASSWASSLSMAFSFAAESTVISLPHSVFTPTPVTSIAPYPSVTLVPDSRNGSFVVSFFTRSLSPVMLDSSTSRA